MIRATAPAGGLPGVCNCSLLAALLALCSAIPAQAEDLQQPVPAGASAAGEVTTATPITGEPAPVPAYDGYSSAAAAEMAARYRAPSLGGGRALNTSQRSIASLWRDTSAPTRSIWRVGLAPSLPAPQMVGGPPPASPHVELAFTARVERFDRGFKPRSDADAWKELGTFRMQLGGANEMALKPRRGGLSLSWQSKF